MQVNGNYNPRRFDATTMSEAMGIILSPDDDVTTDQRWRTETPYLVDLMEPLGLNHESVVLDYGCGVGRLSRAIIERYCCQVIGVDISASMRALASSYVNSPRFMACHPRMLSTLGIKCDAALSVWVLQHCLKPQDDIAAIRAATKDAAKLFVVNERMRFVPTTNVVWIDDGIDVREMLGAGASGPLDPQFVTKTAAQRDAYWWIG